MFSYNFLDDIFYTDNYKTVTGRTLYSEVTEGTFKTVPQYSLEAYATCLKHTYTLQMQNNMLVPVYTNRLALGALYNMLKQDVDNDYVIIVERFIINDSAGIENMIEYYSGAELRCIANSKENMEMCLSIRKRLQGYRFPIEIKVMHLINLSKAKGTKKLYLPNLNMVLYTDEISVRDTHPLKHYVGDVVAKKLLSPSGAYQIVIKIIDNDNPDKIYYTKIFGEVCRIQSKTNLLESNSVKIVRLLDNLEIENKIIRDFEELKDHGIYNSKTECEHSTNIDKILEMKKIELSIEKLDMDKTKNLLEHSHNLKKIELENRKIKFEDNKLKVEYVKLDNDILKMAVELKVMTIKLTQAMNGSSNNSLSSTLSNSKNILEIGNGALKLVGSTINLLV